MTYWLINLWFLGVAVAVAGLALSLAGRPQWRAMAGALGIVLVLTAIFDNAIIGFGIVDYDPEKISGLRLGFAPLEDFAYTVAAALLIPSLWSFFTRPTRKAPAP